MLESAGRTKPPEPKAKNPDKSTVTDYVVYIMFSPSRTLYVGVTNEIARRVLEHREKRPGTFSARYNTTMLAYYEVTPDVYAAISREKQLKGWSRPRKLELIESMNPDWRDLSGDLLDDVTSQDTGGLDRRDSPLRSE